MPPKGRKGLAAEDFETKDLKDHILDIPDTYVGSTEPRMVKEWIFDQETESMIQVDMDLPEAVKRVTLEIISNAGDGAYFSRTEGVDPGQLDFSWDNEGYLVVRNGGLPVPVEPLDKKSTPDKVYLIPTDVFSVPLTSSNYDVKKDRVGCGRNGYGSKLTNSFSKHFIVEIGDSGRTNDKGEKISGQEYIGEWRNNMREEVTSQATPGFKYNKTKEQWERIKEKAFNKDSYVQVSWQLDFRRMNMKRDHYSKEELGLFSRYMIEYSLTCGVPITINGEYYDFRSIRKFAGLFYPEEQLEHAVSHFCASKERPFPNKFKSQKKQEQQEEFIIDSGFIPESQILLVDTPDNGEVFSYVNGLLTIDGGVHVDKLQNELFKPMVKQVNDKIKASTRLNIKDIKPHVTIFLVCRVTNSKYNSQSKTKLESPTPNITFSDEHVKKLLSSDWRLFERLENALGAKDVKGLAKSDGKKVAHLNLSKDAQDANEAGKSKSHQCTLYIAEGTSASGYPKRRIIENEGKDFGGVYAIQGKPMNVTTHKPSEIAEYKEFENIKKMLGLRQGMDYTNEANFKTLRYGKVVFATDADSDGMHIIGLLINLFYKFWPTLFKRGFVRQLVTPVVRAFPRSSKKEPYRFFDENSFILWCNKNPDIASKCEIKYYKGLGSANLDEIKEDILYAPIMVLENDEKGRDLLELAFDKTRANERKTWIQDWRDIRDSVKPFEPKKLEEPRTTGYVMNYLFPPYMIDNLFRSIPGVNDGLKKCQRQVLYGGLQHFNYGKNYNENLRGGVKSSIFSAKVIDIAKYHHGPKSLLDAIQKMTRDYPGSNNLPVFRKYGDYGSRECGGKNAADSRYVELSFSWWMQHAFNKEMASLVNRREVDGEHGEPIWIPCDIPMGVVNGCKGVATGWSTYIPPHHPLSVINWILARLEGQKRIEPLAPYYNGFTGTIDIRFKPPKNPTPSKKGSERNSVNGSVTDSPTSSKSSKQVRKKGISDDSSNESSVYGDTSDYDDDDIEMEFTSGRGFIIRGEFKIIQDHGMTKDIIIHEIPITTPTLDYLKFIQKLLEDKHIKDFKDYSNPDGAVEIHIFGIRSKLVNYKDLKLESGMPLSNMVLLDNDGIPTCYNSVESILGRYVINMLDMYQRYKDHNIGIIKDKIAKSSMEYKIMKAYIDKKLLIQDRTDEQVEANLKELELDKSVYDTLYIRQMNKTNMEKLKKKIEEFEVELKEIKKKTPQKLWTERLINLKKEYTKRFPKELDDIMMVGDTQNMIVDGEYSYKRASIKYM